MREKIKKTEYAYVQRECREQGRKEGNRGIETVRTSLSKTIVADFKLLSLH
jgi:hypothetical protein